ncbi:MAG: hypothetical protein WDM79_18435 [Terricaulis sp.]
MLERDGIMGVLQYEPSSTFSSTLDVFYSEFEEVQTLRGVELPLFWGGGVTGAASLHDRGWLGHGRARSRMCAAWCATTSARATVR